MDHITPSIIHMDHRYCRAPVVGATGKQEPKPESGGVCGLAVLASVAADAAKKLDRECDGGEWDHSGRTKTAAILVVGC